MNIEKPIPIKIGDRFGNYEVIKEVIVGPKGSKRLLCRCDCKSEKLLFPYILWGNHSKRCSSCRDKNNKALTEELSPSFIHGKSGTAIYKIWVGMITRCYNPKVKIYKYYGGRGIQVSESWQNFENFYRDMGERPSGLQIDRIDNDKGYTKENCRWVTAKENNAANKGDLKDSMPGKKFGKWLVISKVNHKAGHWYYLCRCECGTEGIKAGGELRRGRTTQCISCKNISHRGWFERHKNK